MENDGYETRKIIENRGTKNDMSTNNHTNAQICARISRVAIGFVLLTGAVGLWAQAPGGDEGMGPHRPPMERAMGPHGMDRGRWWDDARLIEKYKLTDSQRKSMDDVYQQHRVALVDLHGTLEKAELAMVPLRDFPPFVSGPALKPAIS